MNKLKKKMGELSKMNKSSVEMEYLYGSVAGLLIEGLTEDEALLYHQKLKDRYYELLD